MLILVLDSNLASVFIGALAGNTAAQFPSSTAEDLSEELIQLIFWITRPDLKEVAGRISSSDNHGSEPKLLWICNLSFPLELPIGGELGVDGMVQVVPHPPTNIPLCLPRTFQSTNQTSPCH